MEPVQLIDGWKRWIYRVWRRKGKVFRRLLLRLTVEAGSFRAAIQKSVRIKLLLAHRLVVPSSFSSEDKKIWMTSEVNLIRISLADRGGQVPQRQVCEISFPWSLTRRWAEPYKTQTLTKFYQEDTSLPLVQKYYCLCYLNRYNIEYQKCSKGLPNVKFKYKLQMWGGYSI